MSLLYTTLAQKNSVHHAVLISLIRAERLAHLNSLTTLVIQCLMKRKIKRNPLCNFEQNPVNFSLVPSNILTAF